MPSASRTPVVAGWFTTHGGGHPGAGDTAAGAHGTGDLGAGDLGAGDEGFRLLGTRCTACASVFFPREDSFCRNPACECTELVEVPLSKRGRVWSYTDGRYRPPAPYVSDPEAEWEPYTLVAVELEAEAMVVLGQAAPGVGVGDLAVGMEVEVVPGVLNEDARTIWTTWHWRPVARERGTSERATPAPAASEQASDQASEQASDQASNRVSDHAKGRASDQVTPREVA